LAVSNSNASRIAARIVHVLTRPWLQVTGVVLAVTVSVWSFDRVHGASWTPALIGLMPWIVGKYVLCPLRWHAISESGKRRSWHLRAYAESELMGLLTPGHVGADFWRVKRLKNAGMHVPTAVAEVALDRLVAYAEQLDRPLLLKRVRAAAGAAKSGMGTRG